MKATDKFADLKKRIWFLVGALIVYRIGSFITVPGVNPAELVNQTKGGIFELFEDEAESKVPVLGDLPAVGNLFKNKTRSTRKQEMLVFITPKVISDRGPTR